MTTEKAWEIVREELRELGRLRDQLLPARKRTYTDSELAAEMIVADHIDCCGVLQATAKIKRYCRDADCASCPLYDDLNDSCCLTFTGTPDGWEVPEDV